MSNELVHRFRESLHERGLLITLKGILAKIGDYLFDLRYGTSTAQEVLLKDLSITSANRAFGINYMPTHARPMRRLLRTIDLPKDGTFVDLGCGKGKTLLIASQWGFRKVVGVEFSPELCEAARKNIQIFKSRSRVQCEFEIVEADASKYQIRPDQNVFFMFNPFEASVMKEVLNNIADSVRQKPRAVWLIYNHPSHDNLIQAGNLFVKDKLLRFGACEFAVYMTML